MATRPFSFRHSFFAKLLLLGPLGCAAASTSTYPPDAPTRPAIDTPARFLVGTIPPGGPLTEPSASGACRSPMVDPRDGTEVRLIQSQSGGDHHIGDYAIPGDRYGVRSGELLRLNCGTGQPIGFVSSRR